MVDVLFDLILASSCLERAFERMKVEAGRAIIVQCLFVCLFARLLLLTSVKQKA